MRRLSLVLGVLVVAACGDKPADPAAAKGESKPALTVSLVQPQSVEWPISLAAGGNIAAWQEAVIGPELANYRIAEVLVNVGDRVTAGQVLARIAPDAVAAEQAETRASAAEAQAALEEARANHERARQLREKGFYSAQQATQAQAALASAQARLDAANARLDSANLRRAKTVVTAPDAGIISARNATVGATVQPGQELFRLIRGGRLEWHAEVAAADLARLAPGIEVRLTAPGGASLQGRVRVLAPTVDPRSHTALVYADLPADAAKSVSAGMYARGEFRLGTKAALALPQAAVLRREGFAYVFRVEGNKAIQTKVVTGRQNDERIEVEGLAPDQRVVASGVGFLADGDVVRVAEATPAKAAK